MFGLKIYLELLYSVMYDQHIKRLTWYTNTFILQVIYVDWSVHILLCQDIEQPHFYSEKYNNIAFLTVAHCNCSIASDTIYSVYILFHQWYILHILINLMHFVAKKTNFCSAKGTAMAHCWPYKLTDQWNKSENRNENPQMGKDEPFRKPCETLLKLIIT